MKLNEKQKLAVEHEGGPVLIVAGAGTGKTTVITERIKWLIDVRGVRPEKIWAATFTQKAAEEMRNRLDEVMPLSYIEPYLGTFHGLADKLLRAEGLEIGINPNYTLMNTTDQWLFIRQYLRELKLKYYRPLGNPDKFIAALVTFFSRLQDEDVATVTLSGLALKNRQKGLGPADEMEAERQAELAQAFRIYEQLKRDRAVMDFGDLLRLVLKLFRERANIREKYQNQFSYWLIDEFQDTNYAQYTLIKLLAPAEQSPSLMVVGDDNQSIYKFRGASVANILEFKQDYPRADEVVLTDNYRSTQPILDAAYRLIKHNDPETLEAKLKISKQLKSQAQKQGELQGLVFERVGEEVSWTVEKIQELVNQKGVSYRNIAILARTNAALEEYAAALRQVGLPYQLVANRGLFDQEEVKNLIQWLRVVVDPTDTLALLTFLGIPTVKISMAQSLAWLAKARTKGMNLWEVVRNEDNETAKKVVAEIEMAQKMAAIEPVGRLLYRMVLETGYVNQFLEKDSVENQLKMKNLNLFFERVKQFEAVSTNRSVVYFLDMLELWLMAGDNPGQAQIEDVDTITLMTAHAAKGLEYEAVFMGSLVAGKFPSVNRRDLIEIPEELIKQTKPGGDAHLAEERRLFYVGMTRARRYLYLTAAIDLGGRKKWRPSGLMLETNVPITDKKIADEKGLMSEIKGKENQQQEGWKLTRVSYSKLDTFKACPLKFKYRYIWQIPVRPHHAMAFGRTMHATLQEFHEREMRGESVAWSDLKAIYERQFIEEGYLSAEHKAERKVAGEEALRKYFGEYKQVLGQPVALEKNFTMKIDGVTLTGKIDRIERTDEGRIAIVDYKTGEPQDQKAVDKDEQLTIYALAAEEALGIKPESLSLYFLEKGGGRVETKRNEKQLAKAKEKLAKQIDRLRRSGFEATPNEFRCRYCEYNKLCPKAAISRN